MSGLEGSSLCGVPDKEPNLVTGFIKASEIALKDQVLSDEASEPNPLTFVPASQLLGSSHHSLDATKYGRNSPNKELGKGSPVPESCYFPNNTMRVARTREVVEVTKEVTKEPEKTAGKKITDYFRGYKEQ